MYIPLYNATEKKPILRIPAKLCFLSASIPIFAIIICVLLTMYKDFESANNTHCKVPNVFPSISASIGNYDPQKTIWKVAIYMHSPFRFFMLTLRWKFYRSTIREDLHSIVNVTVLLNVIENFSLVGLTYWTSSENYELHEKCFKTFIGTSIFYMLLTCMMITKYRRRPLVTHREKLSLKLKWRTCLINVVSFALAAYFFLRHNSLCEPYVYSMFGFFEYIVVLSNMAFHLTTIYDLQLNYFCIDQYGISAE